MFDSFFDFLLQTWLACIQDRSEVCIEPLSKRVAQDICEEVGNHQMGKNGPSPKEARGKRSKCGGEKG